MKTRIITAIVAIALFIPICYFSDTVIFPIAIGILCAVAVFEMAKCINCHKKLAIIVPCILIGLVMPILPYFLSASLFISCAIATTFLLLIYMLAYVMFGMNKEKITDIMSLFALIFYVIGCFVSIVMIRVADDGKYLYLLIFLGAWVSDTFAYFTGRLIGKHKLIPQISPKKTVEGAIGGVVFTIGAFILYGVIIKGAIPYYKLAILGTILPIVSQIGDLIASAIKRQYEIKDYGFVFPGHGGVLDRFDSVMLVSPVLLIITSIL